MLRWVDKHPNLFMLIVNVVVWSTAGALIGFLSK